MIEIIATQKVLIGFPLAAMLCDDETGHNFQRFGGTRERPRIDLFAAHGLFTGSRGRSGGNRSLGIWFSIGPRRSAAGRRWVSGHFAVPSPFLCRHRLSPEVFILAAVWRVDFDLGKPGGSHALRRGRRCHGHQIDQYKPRNAQRSTHRPLPATTVRTNESHRDVWQAMLQTNGERRI